MKVWVTSEAPVWLGFQSERESNKGGRIGVSIEVGVGLKGAKIRNFSYHEFLGRR